MKNRKVIVVLALSLVLAVVAFSGCIKKTGNETESGTEGTATEEVAEPIVLETSATVHVEIDEDAENAAAAEGTDDTTAPEVEAEGEQPAEGTEQATEGETPAE
ncbi:MAG: hypothetical protein LBQ95_06630 [Lachnospiraceae bacterium]|jgi:hypothetical protein|nr:hypothetical protein [Lachnospiraceae bacterium]